MHVIIITYVYIYQLLEQIKNDRQEKIASLMSDEAITQINFESSYVINT